MADVGGSSPSRSTTKSSSLPLLDALSEAVIEGVAGGFDVNGQRRSTHGDCEFVEESDLSKDNEELCVPWIDEADFCMPFDEVTPAVFLRYSKSQPSSGSSAKTDS